MFSEDDLWEVLVEGTLEFKKSEESDATQFSTVSNVENAQRIVSQMPIMQKKELFAQTFE